MPIEMEISVGYKSCAYFEEGLSARLLLLGVFCSTCLWFGLWKDWDFYSWLLAGMQTFPCLQGLINDHWRRELLS